MDRFRQTAMVLLVWATSASTLLAGIPRLECRCLGGKFQSLASGTAAKGRTCCCGKTCPPKGDGKPVGSSRGHLLKKPSCCSGTADPHSQGQPGDQGSRGGKEQKHTAGKSGEQLLPRTNGCQKTLVPPEQQSLSRAVPKDRENPTANLFILADLSTALCLPVLPSARPVWEVFRLPPPTDLITLLQRLTI